MAALFPADCRICGDPLTTLSRLPVCHECLESMQPMRVPSCSICGERLFSAAALGSFAGAPDLKLENDAPPLCGPCRNEPPEFTRAAAFGSYDGALRELIHLLKYNGVKPAAAVLGGMLARALLNFSAEFGEVPPVAVPVPLYSSKLRSRGFNQSEAVARIALKHFRTAKLQRLELNTRVLARVRQTQSQTGLTRAQRRENVRGAFSVLRPDEVMGRDVLLLDDVLTTGTTAGECARVLKQSGAERICVATVARVFAPEPMQMPEPEQIRTMQAHA
jgi:ComF family protein